MKRWLKFNGVGTLGAVVQLSALTVLKSGLGLHYLMSTLVAVELAVLHNFVWHERWTWAERTKPTGAGWRERLVRFHTTNGFISTCGNLFVMSLLVSRLRVNYVAANILSIGACSAVNFLASDRIVFQSSPSGRGCPPPQAADR
jgi:putative flippase GtrA